MLNIVAKFRGFAKEENRWVYGAYVKQVDAFNEVHHYIVHTSPHPLAEDTVQFTYIEIEEKSLGQYIEGKDQHGTPIYTGDILHSREDEYKESNLIGVVSFNEADRAFELLVKPGEYQDIWDNGPVKDTSVLGNTFEHLQLITDKGFTEKNID